MLFSDIFPCNETGAVKLTHSNVDTCGRLELCYDGHWNSVCSNHADNMIASVVCRQLGYAENGWKIGLFLACLLHTSIFQVKYSS